MFILNFCILLSFLLCLSLQELQRFNCSHCAAAPTGDEIIQFILKQYASHSKATFIAKSFLQTLLRNNFLVRNLGKKLLHVQ